MKSEERRVKNPCAKVMLASIINKTNVPADLRSAGIEYKKRSSAQLIVNCSFAFFFRFVFTFRFNVVSLSADSR